jgi:hypothetical protein
MTSDSNPGPFPHWKQLALKAAREKDTEKLIALVNELLEEIERDKTQPKRSEEVGLTHGSKQNEKGAR